jgi:hypothetical protein
MLDLNALDLGVITYALSDQAAYEHCWLRSTVLAQCQRVEHPGIALRPA